MEGVMKRIDLFGRRFGLLARPTRRYGEGFAVLGAAPPGQGFVNGFIDTFFTELAVLTEAGRRVDPYPT